MALGIYKPGQGYWVRVMTCVMVGALTLAGALWAWGQAEAIRLPAAAHSVALRAITGEINAGDQVEYLRPGDDAAGTPEVYGTAVVTSVGSTTGRAATLRTEAFSSDEVRDGLSQATRMRSASGAFDAQVVSGSELPPFPRVYLQAGAAGVVLIAGFIIAYWAAGFGAKPNEFLIATDGEMKKVNWSTWREIKGSTIVVIVAAFMIAGALYGVDQVFAWFFRAVGVLET